VGYRYSGIMHTPRPLTEELQELQTMVEDLAEISFNSVLLNLYRDGRDSVGWHADNEPGLGSEPVIASLSLGAVRRFQLKHRTDRAARVALDLPNGSCLVMRGKTQQYWRHQLPKTRAPVGPRINLTFRRMVGEPSAVSLAD
jgi:alkylated DNA repair dioxygenase AlkB